MWGTARVWRLGLLILAAGWSGGNAAAGESVVFFTNEAEWVAAVMDRETFVTTAANIGLSDEVDAPIGNNAEVGSNLTFQAGATGLSRSFRVATLQAGAGFTFNDNEQGMLYPAMPGFEDALSIGDINDFENDDCEIVMLDGPELYALGFELGENDPAQDQYPDMGCRVYGTTGDWLGASSFLSAVSNGFAFFGLVSEQAIGRVVVDGDANGDDMSIRNFQFGVSKPVMRAIAPAVAGGVVLRWSSVTNRVYDLQRCEGAPGEFHEIAADIAATPPANLYTVSVSAAAAVFQIRSRAQ